jgi:hypothetical protein
VVVDGEQRLDGLFAADGRIVQQADLIRQLGVRHAERPCRRAPAMSRPIGGERADAQDTGQGSRADDADAAHDVCLLSRRG